MVEFASFSSIGKYRASVRSIFRTRTISQAETILLGLKCLRKTQKRSKSKNMPLVLYCQQTWYFLNKLKSYIDKETNIALIAFIYLLQKQLTNHQCIVRILKAVEYHDLLDSLMVIVESINSFVKCWTCQDFCLNRCCLNKRSIVFILRMSAW